MHVCKMTNYGSYDLQGRSPINLRFSIYRALVEYILYYEITLHGSCSGYNIRIINRRIKKDRKQHYLWNMLQVSTQQKYCKLEILPSKSFFVLWFWHNSISKYKVCIHKTSNTNKNWNKHTLNGMFLPTMAKKKRGNTSPLYILENI